MPPYFQEYKDSNLWYAGFVFATATAILRIANNKHYSSDVLAGAGITVREISD
jgi:membrane-associated phospholipid phosphatase